ncbi:RICIN domain-containing protein [Streptomyces sp. NPDC056549]|uniref:RICIN domain-containing protein n=1 Tax=unclassified Streptomyces TaxID=2593676 RepID=UPI00367576C7
MQRTMKLTAFARAKHGLLVVAASLGLLLGLSAPPAQASSFIYLGTVAIESVDSKKCLEVADWSKADGAAVRQWDCHYGDNQKWYRWGLSDDVDVSFYINVNSGKCLEIGGWNRNNGATANQWGCHYGLNQRYLGQSRLRMEDAYVYNKCIEIADWRKDNGAPARLWDCHDGNNQYFNIYAV